MHKIVWPVATLVNMLTVTIGSMLGLWFKGLFSNEVEILLFQALGLCTIYLGMDMALKLPEGKTLHLIFSILLGSVVGYLLGIKVGLIQFSIWLQDLFSYQESSFGEGMITAFLLFCVGSMTIVGAIEEGLYKKRQLLYVKSTLDLFSSIALSSVYGIGVLFSILPMLIFQGGLTILADRSKVILKDKVIAFVSAVGGILIIGIGFNLLKIVQIPIENMLPALLVAVLLCQIPSYFPMGK